MLCERKNVVESIGAMGKKYVESCVHVERMDWQDKTCQCSESSNIEHCVAVQVPLGESVRLDQ
jgi:hypothetical protein